LVYCLFCFTGDSLVDYGNFDFDLSSDFVYSRGDFLCDFCGLEFVFYVDFYSICDQIASDQEVFANKIM